MADALKNKIAGVFDEPACRTNVSKSEQQRKKGCARPLTPGAAAGGCAFDGAKIALQPIVDVAHLVHAPLACEGNGWDNRGAASSGSERYRTGFTTDMTEIDIVMVCGEKKLFRAIREVIEAEDPPAVFVCSTCVPALIGDDIDAVCKAATAKFGTPCIPVNASGYVGPKNLGNKLAGEAMLDHVIGTVEPAELTPYDINIVGDYNLSGELWQVKPLPDRLGIHILGSLAADARYRQVAMMHRAKVTMMVCSKAVINIARKLEERYGIPYFEGSFDGISDNSDSLRQMCRLMVAQGADPALLDRCEALIAAAFANPVHDWLARVRPPMVLDTWCDDGLLRAFERVRDWGLVQGVSRSGEWIDIFTRACDIAGTEVGEASADWKTLLYKPHGLARPGASFLISDSDYVEVLSEIDIQRPIPEEQQRRRTGRPLLFLGCRFDDQMLRTFACQIGKRSAEGHVALMPGPLTRMKARFLDELGITWLDLPVAALSEMLTVPEG